MTPDIREFLNFIITQSADVHYHGDRGPDEGDPTVSMSQGSWEALQDEAAVLIASSTVPLEWLPRGNSVYAVSRTLKTVFKIVPHNNRYALKLNKVLIDTFPHVALARDHAQSLEDEPPTRELPTALFDLRALHQQQIITLLTDATAATPNQRDAARYIAMPPAEYRRLCTLHSIPIKEGPRRAPK